MKYENIVVPEHKIKWMRESTRPSKPKKPKKDEPIITPPLLCAGAVLIPETLVEEQINVVCVLEQDDVKLIEADMKEEINREKGFNY